MPFDIILPVLKIFSHHFWEYYILGIADIFCIGNAQCKLFVVAKFFCVLLWADAGVCRFITTVRRTCSESKTWTLTVLKFCWLTCLSSISTSSVSWRITLMVLVQQLKSWPVARFLTVILTLPYLTLPYLTFGAGAQGTPALRPQ